MVKVACESCRNGRITVRVNRQPRYVETEVMSQTCQCVLSDSAKDSAALSAAEEGR